MHRGDWIIQVTCLVSIFYISELEGGKGDFFFHGVVPPFNELRPRGDIFIIARSNPQILSTLSLDPAFIKAAYFDFPALCFCLLPIYHYPALMPDSDQYSVTILPDVCLCPSNKFACLILVSKSF